MELKIVTGMSGAGKTNMVQVLEDMGYYCVDNLPPNLFLKFVELMLQAKSELEQVALVADVRGGKFFLDVYDVLQELKNKGISYEIIFLEASDEVLVRRFKETRRRHPLAERGKSVLEGIQEERQRLQRLRGAADLVIDTSGLRVADFKELVREHLGRAGESGLQLTITSFGFKYGLPIDVDLVMDVRFLPNPFYVPELKALSGLDEPVRDYVLQNQRTVSFLRRYGELLRELLPQYQQEGKRDLALAIGCTGGRHRSVAVAEELGRRLSEDGIFNVKVKHRDINR